VRVAVEVAEGVDVAVTVEVEVFDRVGVGVALRVGVEVGVMVRVGEGEGVKVRVKVGVTPAAPVMQVQPAGFTATQKLLLPSHVHPPWRISNPASTAVNTQLDFI
jgi:hypothetical protein